MCSPSTASDTVSFYVYPAHHYNPTAAMFVDYAAPCKDVTALDNPGLKANPGDKVILSVEGVDLDVLRPNASANWTVFQGTGPYNIRFSSQGPASFTPPPARAETTKKVYNIESGNVYLYVSADWDGQEPLSVTATLEDEGHRVMPSPNTGSVMDGPVTVSWTFTRGTHFPTSMRLLRSNDVVLPGGKKIGTVFYYEGEDDPAPLYEGVTVLEEFDLPTPEGTWTMNDLDPVWKGFHVGLNTREKVARHLWRASRNSSHVLKADNSFNDGNTGTGDLSPFLPDSKNKAGYRAIQRFVCNGKVIGQFAIIKTFSPDGDVLIEKSRL